MYPHVAQAGSALRSACAATSAEAPVLACANGALACMPASGRGAGETTLCSVQPAPRVSTLSCPCSCCGPCRSIVGPRRGCISPGAIIDMMSAGATGTDQPACCSACSCEACGAVSASSFSSFFSCARLTEIDVRRRSESLTHFCTNRERYWKFPTARTQWHTERASFVLAPTTAGWRSNVVAVSAVPDATADWYLRSAHRAEACATHSCWHQREYFKIWTCSALGTQACMSSGEQRLFAKSQLKCSDTGGSWSMVGGVPLVTMTHHTTSLCPPRS